jgi:transmembrane sensor
MYDKTAVGLGILAELKRTWRSLGLWTPQSWLMPSPPDAPGDAPQDRQPYERDHLSLFSLGILALLGFVNVAEVGLMILDTGLSEYETPVGAQKVLRFADQSRCRLNSGTKIKIRETRHFLTIALLRGEILCQLTHRLNRTVKVFAGSATITDIGTLFDVRLRGASTVLTVVEGAVQLAVTGSNTASSTDRSAKHLLDSRLNKKTVSAGERWEVVSERDHIAMIPEVVTLPQIYRSIAWERGRVSFSNDTLADAVAEMNRYNPAQIVVPDPDIGARRVTGTFNTHDPVGFVLGVTRQLEIHFRQDPPSGPATTIYLE